MMQQAGPIAIAADPPPDRSELLRRARALVPALRARAEQGEALRRVPDETIADLIGSGVLRTCQPIRFGGSGLGWDAVCEIAMELGRGDGSQAWVANVYAEHAYILALFEDRAQREVWDDAPRALLAASIVPQGNDARPVEGGYRLSGRWGFTSGVHHADWIILAEMAKDAAGARHCYFLVPAADYRILDDWHTIGMVGTGSSSVALENVFIPAHRVIANDDVTAGTTPGARFADDPLLRMPILGFAQLALAAVPIGVVAGMLDDFRPVLRKAASGAGAELLQERYSASAAELHAARLLLLDAARGNMETLARGEALVEADAARSLRDAAYAVTLAKRAATRLFEATGGRGIYLASPMQRAFRDVQASGGHGSLNWERSALRYARSAMV
ncbi:MAG TPA: acyl-CoA dehydrogenase family protein [Hyphomicrobiales bacterium]|nr:acyl-CoA dehydrogenase family protein [Hyphomicrobiales bacterium]